MTAKSLAYFPLLRFCADCNQESTETSWSRRWRTRLCMDCYSIRCEGDEADYAGQHDCMMSDGFQPAADNGSLD